MSFRKILSRFQISIFARSIRHGLTLAIPFLIMGSFSLLLNNFPIDSYQVFLASWLHGTAAQLLNTIYTISLGSLALVLTVTISISYGQLAETDQFLLYPVVSVCSYLAFCGGIKDQTEYIFSAEWVFTAMCITMLACVLFQRLLRFGRRFERLHTTGADYLFNVSIQSLVPVIVITLFFTITGYLVRITWSDSNITNFGSYLFLKLFNGISGNLFGILLYVVITHVLWFLGIHGTNTLEAVSRQLFEPNVEINQALMTAGSLPTEIFSKTFLDTFVFLGGCGTALSFVIALCIASGQSHNRKIAHVALPSVLFNISEIAVFGFPIIFNFTMAVPFIITPVVLTVTSALAIHLGLVPAVTQSVDWTVPVLLSGYKSTGSIAGSLLQLFNLIIGTMIYIPFIRRSEKLEAGKFTQAIRQMEADMASGEKQGNPPRFLTPEYPCYYYAKTLAMDLQNAIKRGQVQLYYQAQLSHDGTLHGMEALMRWKHPVTGFIAPPVLAGLAYEHGFLDELGSYLIRRACLDAQTMERLLKKDAYLSVNVSSMQIKSDVFFDMALSLIKQYPAEHIHPVFEITERAALEISDHLKIEMEHLRSQGVEFSLDDFGMGHNSLLQLQEDAFDEVKLDGNLVSQLLTNKRSREIVSSIIQMSRNLNCRIVAEFVETAELRNVLSELGCSIYQGYYYCRPLPLEEFMDYISRLPEKGHGS